MFPVHRFSVSSVHVPCCGAYCFATVLLLCGDCLNGDWAPYMTIIMLLLHPPQRQSSPSGFSETQLSFSFCTLCLVLMCGRKTGTEVT